MAPLRLPAIHQQLTEGAIAQAPGESAAWPGQERRGIGSPRAVRGRMQQVARERCGPGCMLEQATS